MHSNLLRYLRMWWNDLVYAWDTYLDARTATKRRYFSKEDK